jgi:hypothetical protein
MKNNRNIPYGSESVPWSSWMCIERTNTYSSDNCNITSTKALWDGTIHT